MSENIIIALLGVASSMLLVNWRLKKLEEKVDRHNSYSDKIASLTQDVALIQKDIEYIKKALDKLGK